MADHKNRCFGGLLGEPPGGFQAIRFRHHEIHHGDVGCVFLPLLDGATTILGLTDNNPFVLLLQDGPKTRADHGIVIDQK